MCSRQQHAVAEHVARHVADTDHAERLALDVDIHLAEVALDALPGATRGDRHLLVVVAGRAARGEGIAEPEAVRDRRSRWRCRRTWPCPCRPPPPDRDHRRRGAPRAAGGTIAPSLTLSVTLEQRGNENAVGGDALRLHVVAPAGARHLLGQEAALGTGRHDHCVLHDAAHAPGQGSRCGSPVHGPTS